MKKPLTNYGHSARVRLLALANEFFAPTLADDGAELVWRFSQKKWTRR